MEGLVDVGRSPLHVERSVRPHRDRSGPTVDPDRCASARDLPKVFRVEGGSGCHLGGRHAKTLPRLGLKSKTAHFKTGLEQPCPSIIETWASITNSATSTLSQRNASARSAAPPWQPDSWRKGRSAFAVPHQKETAMQDVGKGERASGERCLGQLARSVDPPKSFAGIMIIALTRDDPWPMRMVSVGLYAQDVTG